MDKNGADKPNKTIEVRVPASSANLGSGTDCMGIALPIFLTVRFVPAAYTTITYTGPQQPPVDLEHDLIYVAMKAVSRAMGKKLPGVSIQVHSDIPLCSGLGSSAAAIVAGACGANALLGYPFNTDKLAQIASIIEGHPDNVVPCLIGGCNVAMMNSKEVYYQNIELDESLTFIAVTPRYRLPTKIARSALPRDVSMHSALRQLQHGCYLVTLLYTKQYEKLKVACDDSLFTPVRRKIIRGYDAVTSAAMDRGAYCALISGAGPTILALCGPECDHQDISDSMQEGFTREGLKCTAHIMNADNKGAVVTEI